VEVSTSKATPRPWSVARAGESIWIQGPKGSGTSSSLPGSRRIVCEFRLYGDEELDAETEANFALIVEAANAR
jgi:hypothetical protein